MDFLFKTDRKSVVKQWLLHAFLYWTLTNAYEAIDYYLRVLSAGKYFIHFADGSDVTAWDLFWDYNRYQYNWLRALAFTLIVELLRVRIYEKRKFKQFVFAALGAGLAWGLVFTLYNNWKYQTGSLDITWGVLKLSVYALVFAIAREFVVQRLYRKEIRLTKSEAELNLLRAQVNPHFFFNTFNYVYGTALAEQAPKTAEAIEMMTEMMRYTLSVTQEKLVPLTAELGFIRNYIRLQQLRLPERENITLLITIEGDDTVGMVTPMLMIVLVENAFKYGISIDASCFIRIDIRVTGDQLQLDSENSIPRTGTSDGLGTGIANLRQRLKLVYPGKHRFTSTQTESRYSTHLQFPIL